MQTVADSELPTNFSTGIVVQFRLTKPEPLPNETRCFNNDYVLNGTALDKVFHSKQDQIIDEVHLKINLAIFIYY